MEAVTMIRIIGMTLLFRGMDFLSVLSPSKLGTVSNYLPLLWLESSNYSGYRRIEADFDVRRYRVISECFIANYSIDD
jgi:hypothetical protein